MKGMLKAELFKFKYSYSLWIIISVVTISCGFSIVTGVYRNAEVTLASISQDNMVPILACAIYSAIILTDDFSNGLLKHYIANGYKKTSIILAKFIHYILGCSILLFLYPYICVILAVAIQGTQTTPWVVFQTMLSNIVKTLPLYWGIFGLFFCLSILIQKGAIAIGTSVAVSILLVVFTNKLYEGTASILRYSPVIQIKEVTAGPVTFQYFIAVLVSLIILAICLFGSMLKFKHDEL